MAIDKLIERANDRRVANIHSVADARAAARRRVPPTVFDYIDGGAEDETTLAANRRALEMLPIVPRLGSAPGTPAPSLATTVLGTPIDMPVMLAPIGFTRMMHRSGDLAGAAAAAGAGTIFTVSTFSGHSIEDVAVAGTGPKWFQLYFLGGRKGAEQLVTRARDAGYRALVVTLDTQAVGNRERDLHHGVRVPLKVDLRSALRFAPEVLTRPTWLYDFARDRFNIEMANATSLVSAGGPLTAGGAHTYWGSSAPVWEDFAWIRDLWTGPIIAKGILSAEDARRAVGAGATAVIVSNHGGRQLDGAPPTISVLPAIVAAVGEQVEVLVDSGFRRGVDVVRALSLGARAVMIGRPWAFALAAGGEPGVRQVLSMFAKDLDRVLRLIGVQSIQDLDESILAAPNEALFRAR